ncbi:MAG: hypothetical protein AAF490_19160 [Chloroflexota bacterium]
MAGFICGPIFFVIAYTLFKQFKNAKLEGANVKAYVTFALSSIFATAGILYLIAAIFG